MYYYTGPDPWQAIHTVTYERWHYVQIFYMNADVGLQRIAGQGSAAYHVLVIS